ncbi:MAG: hypothetical protein IPH62_15115 [Ignavibacteriae bacterium]|nr:hypothetical protein [Ignavibacteriota bacterium]
MSNDITKTKPKKIRNVKSARRLLADLIYYLQLEIIPSEKAKSIAYMLIKYGELFKTENLLSIEELEKRFKILEEKINDKKS